MRKNIFILLLCFAWAEVKAQPLQTLYNPDVIQGVLIKITQPLETFKPDPNWVDEPVRGLHGVINEGENIEHRFYQRGYNPDALPKGEDPVIQKEEAGTKVATLLENYNGQGYTSVNPADPSICVGPNYVIQMINGSSGARIIIYNKSGATALAAQYMDAITGIGGLGDPIALYDQFADRYVLTEFASSGNKLIMMVSQTNNPLGSWYVYQFTTPQFPDYPKYAVWPNAYVVTTNESNNKVYAVDRATMLTGAATTTLISFSIPASPSIGFQAAAPVNISGTTAPTGTLPMIMRMTDDAWGSGLNDELQMWALNLNFAAPTSSTMSQMPSLAAASFDTHLCGYTTLNCITQPGTTQKMDPIREILMNRVYLRVFSGHQSIVLSHAVDATGTDIAGVRWYELRKTGTAPWSIYQQSTYAPTTTASRWMPTIGMDKNGNIGLVYNKSGSADYPSIYYTHRMASDPLNTMQTEQVIINGTAAQTSNRWGDYNDLGIDPADDETFWFTAMYKPGGTGWNTRVGSFILTQAPLPLQTFHIKVENQGGKNIIHLETKNEENLKIFRVQRSQSLDFDDAEFIGTIHPENTANNAYPFVDENPMAKTLHYRVEVEDNDGHITYSNTESITQSIEGDISIYPNPLKNGQAFIRLSPELCEQSLYYEIYNMEGTEVSGQKSLLKTQVQSLPVENLSSGMYYIKIGNGHYTYKAQKLIIE